MKFHDHADYRTKPSAQEQVAGTMFEIAAPAAVAPPRDPMAFYPVGSQPVDTSEAAADMMYKSGKAAQNRWLVLERLARGPVTADTFLAEMAEQVGVEHRANSWAPRFTELVAIRCAVYLPTTARTRSGGTAHPASITALGESFLREREAKRRTSGTFFGPSTRE